MKEKLPSLLLVVIFGTVTVAAQDATEAPKSSDTNDLQPAAATSPGTADLASPLAAQRPSPEQLFTDAVAQLNRHSTVAARVRHRTMWFGQRLIGSGRYLQGPPGQHLVRLEMRTPLTDKVSSLQQISDGQTLWIYEYSSAGKNLGRVDVKQAAAAFAASPAALAAPGKSLAIGGLPELLRNLQGVFDFTSVERRLLGDLPTWVLQGTWKPPVLVALMPDQKADIEAGKPNLAALAPQLPDQVLIWLGRDDLFPYRIEFRRNVPADFMKKRNGLIDPRESSMIFEFFEVQFDAAIDPKEFSYDPGPLPAEDRTAGFLKQLGL